MQKPTPNEYKPYFQGYINLVPESDVVAALQQQKDATVSFFEALPADKHDFGYAPEKWTIKQVLMHLIDTERVMSYRALVGIRGDKHTVLCNMDENLYAAHAEVSSRNITDLLEEFAAVRTATIKLLKGINDTESMQEARTEDGGFFTPRALAYIMAGHVYHHINVIKERYLG